MPAQIRIAAEERHPDVDVRKLGRRDARPQRRPARFAASALPKAAIPDERPGQSMRDGVHKLTLLCVRRVEQVYRCNDLAADDSFANCGVRIITFPSLLFTAARTELILRPTCNRILC